MGARVVTIGELLYDVFPDGERLGGAPANFAFHISALGEASSLVSAVGEDSRGENAIAFLDRSGVDASCIDRVDAESGVVSVTVSPEGQPAYEIKEDVAWDRIDLTAKAIRLASEAKAVCWGTLGQRSCRSHSAHRQLFDLVPDACLKVCDINIRQSYHSRDIVLESLKHADLLKLNEEEIPVLRSYLGGSSSDRDFMRELRHRFDIKIVVLTLGALGCWVLADNVDFQEPASPVDVVNTVGAGDAFTAAFVTSFLGGDDFKTCAQYANQIGGYVTTQNGGMPQIPHDLLP